MARSHWFEAAAAVRSMAVAVVALCALSADWVAGQSSSPSAAAVDVVRLKSGRTIRGAIWQRTPSGGLTLVVRRAWLEQTAPDWARQVADDNRRQQQRAWEEARDRLDQLLAAEGLGPRLNFFWQEERDRLQKLLATPPAESEFLWLDVDAKALARVTPADQTRQRIALWAWSEHVADVETRDAAELARQLKQAGVSVDAPPPDLSDRLPARPQSEWEWQARLALLEYTFHKPFDLQGSGDLVFAVGGGEAAPLGAVLPRVLEQQLQTLLGDLADTPAHKPERGWLPSAIRAAEQAGVRGFRVTRVEVSLEPPRSTVTSQFVGRIAPNRWVTLWQATEVADGATPRPAHETRIRNDRQVKGALEALQGLGLADEGALQQALRVGAATMAAQQAVDEQFFRFRDRLARRVDGPPLLVAP
jgi:hypothetical protein